MSVKPAKPSPACPSSSASSPANLDDENKEPEEEKDVTVHLMKKEAGIVLFKSCVQDVLLPRKCYAFGLFFPFQLLYPSF